MNVFRKSIPVISVPPDSGYGACQKVLANAQAKSSIDELTMLSNATAGVMASFFSSFTLCPTELVKCKLQSLREMHVSPNELHKARPKYSNKLFECRKRELPPST